MFASSLVLLRQGVTRNQRFGGRAESGGLLRWPDILITVDFVYFRMHTLKNGLKALCGKKRKYPGTPLGWHFQGRE